jgi:spermidine synthase
VHCIDGAKFVRESKKRYDVLMVDGFDRCGQPAQLCSKAFYDSCYRTLAPGGVMVVNLLGDSMLETIQCVERMRASYYGAVLTIDTRDSSNHIVFACKNGLPDLDATVLQQRIDELDMVCPMALDDIARALRTGQEMASIPI